MADKDKFDEFLEEVESDIRQEKLLSLWHKYGKLATAGLVVVLLMVSGYSLWQNHEAKQRIHLAEQFIEAQDSIANGQIPHALQILQSVMKNSNKTYSVLAQFLDTGVLVQEGGVDNLKKAVDNVQLIADNTHLDQMWRDLASLLYVSLSLDLNEGSDKEKLLARLESLTATGNPWRYLALEFKAILLSQNVDSKAAAAEIFVSLVQDPQVPEGIKSRAQLMGQVLVAELGA